MVMNVQGTQRQLTVEQETYVRFLAAGKRDVQGNKYTKEQFAKLIGVDPATLWRWQQLDGFKEAVFKESMSRLVEHIPAMNSKMIAKTLEKGDVQAYLAIMRQYELLKSDKVDTTVAHTGGVAFTNVIPRNATDGS